MRMNNRPWTRDEVKFVRDNASKGINYLVANMSRSTYSIQRIAYIKGYSLNNLRNKNTKKRTSRKPALQTQDEIAQLQVKFAQENMW